MDLAESTIGELRDDIVSEFHGEDLGFQETIFDVHFQDSL